MGSDEENLDDLLKSLIASEDVSERSDEKSDFAFGAEEVKTDIPDGFDFAIEDNESEAETADGKEYDSDNDIEGFAIEDFDVLEPEPGELEETALDDSSGYNPINDLQDDIIDDNIEVFAIEDFEVAEPGEDFGLGTEDEALIPAADTTAYEGDNILDSSALAGDADDMLALLEGMSEDTIESVNDDYIGDDEHNIEEPEINTKAEDKKKGVLSKIFPGKKKNQQDNTEGHIETESQEDLHDLFGEAEYDQDNDVNAEMEELPIAAENKNKNIFLRIISFLTEADDEGNDEKQRAEHGMLPSDENKNILEELDKEDKKRKKKKVSGRKGQPEGSLYEDDEEGEDAAENQIKKKKIKKNKKKDKASKDESITFLTKDYPGKKISKRNIAIIAGLCLTITAVVIVLCSIVPGFFDKRKARDSYYKSDYEKSYELLYGKKLDNSDTIIFNKSRIVLELNRKLNSYHNYLGIEKEVQALDALMSGVERYSEILPEAEEYHVTQEIGAVYETLLNILSDKYEISEPVAKVINAYDDLTYTRKLESIVHKTPFVLPEEEMSAVPDVLPEEQLLFESNGTQSNEEPVQGEDVTSPAGELPEETAVSDSQEDASVSELPGVTADSELQGVPQDTEVPEETSDNTAVLPEETSDAAAVQPPVENTVDNNISSGQGELIQGIKQPVTVEIHEN